MTPQAVAKKEGKRSDYEILRTQMEAERSTFIQHWRDLGDYILPRRPRFTVSDVNKGDRRNKNIIDSTATLAVRTLRSGMMGGITSPARPWFRLATPDPDLSEFGPVKEWLHLVTQRMSTVFLKSNLYNVLPVLYGDMGCFGTAAMGVEEDLDNVIRFYQFPVGSYMIANNDKLRVDVFFRQFRMTVRQLVRKFGEKDRHGQMIWDNFSKDVKKSWDDNQRETWIDVCHVILPNDEWDPKMLHSKFKRYKSCYYERGQGSNGTIYSGQPDNDVLLRESGFDFFPVLAPRWGVTGEDVYGTDCPGMDALGDTKALQLKHRRKAQAIEKMVNPPMTGPSQLKAQKASILPGDITFLDVRDGQQGFRPVHEVNLRIAELVADIQADQQRISRAFYEDLFLMLSQSDRREITAREIDERHEEKLLALGPVLEQLNQDLLDPLIDITFDIMLRQDLIPDAPEALHGVALRVEYVSMMAQAQKLIGVGGLERFSGFVGQLATASGDLTVLDKVDLDQLITEYGEAVSVPPKIIRPEEDVQKIKQGRAQQAQAQHQAEMVQAGAKSAKDLSQAKMGEESNALTELLKTAKAGSAVPSQ